MDLIAKNLSYKPTDQFHLNDVSFNFKNGNLYTILGRTLSGKTTLLKTIAGLLTPDSGEIDFCLLYTSPSPRDMRRSRMPSSA